MTYWILIMFQALCWAFYIYYFSLLFVSVMYVLTVFSFYTGTKRLKAIVHGHMASNCNFGIYIQSFGSAALLPDFSGEAQGCWVYTLPLPSNFHPKKCLFNTAPLAWDRLKEKTVTRRNEWRKANILLSYFGIIVLVAREEFPPELNMEYRFIPATNTFFLTYTGSSH